MRVVLAMPVCVGRRNVRVTQVVANDLEVHLIALVAYLKVPLQAVEHCINLRYAYPQLRRFQWRC